MTIKISQMKAGLCSLIIFIMFILGNAPGYGYVEEKQSARIKPEFHEPQAVVELYLKAVARGELVVFDKMLTGSLLVPVSVEYVYDLDNAIPEIKVYSKLKQPMPVPGQRGCELRAVSAIIDAAGHIVETEAHIWTE